MDLSIIIVNYNTKDLLRQCLESINDTEHTYTYEIIVVDNNSDDNSVEMVREFFPEVKIVQCEKNEGFARANNKGIQLSSGRYVLLLNPDTIVLPGTFNKMLDFMDSDKSIGAAGCKVMRPNGKLDLACRRSFHTPIVGFYRAIGLSKLFPKSRVFGKYNLQYLDEDETYEVDSVMGAFMMVRRETIEDVGLLDEDYFMYCEDTDWCYRIKSRGWKIYYHPAATIIHIKGESSKKQSYRMIYQFHRSMFIYLRKNHARDTFFLLNVIAYLGIAVRLILLLLANLLKKDKRVSK